MKKTYMSLAAIATLTLGSVTIAQAQDKKVTEVDQHGNQTTVVSGQPAPDNYGPKPPFAQLDVNHDGVISREEAEAFIPLVNDYDHLTYGGHRLTKRAYESWDYR